MGEYFTSGLFCLQRKYLAYEYFITFFFHGEELLVPRPTPKLEDHPLSAVRDCLFNLFTAPLHIGGRSSIRNLRMHHAVVTDSQILLFTYSYNYSLTFSLTLLLTDLFTHLLYYVPTHQPTYLFTHLSLTDLITYFLIYLCT